MNVDEFEFFVSSGTERKRYDLAGFLSLPLDVRIRAVLERRVTVSHFGDPVPTDRALNLIRLASAEGTRRAS